MAAQNLPAEMVETARERAAYAAELQAASSVQQLLLASASRPTPGLKVESVYLPASEVGGDFFFVSPTSDGLSTAASFGETCGGGSLQLALLAPASPLAASILERRIGEIVNGCGADSRVLDSGCVLNALICAPLRAGHRTVGENSVLPAEQAVLKPFG